MIKLFNIIVKHIKKKFIVYTSFLEKKEKKIFNDIILHNKVRTLSTLIVLDYKKKLKKLQISEENYNSLNLKT